MTKLFTMAMATAVLSVQGLTPDAFEISYTTFQKLTGINSANMPCDPFVLDTCPDVGGQDEVAKWKRKARQTEQKVREETYKLLKC